MLSLLRRSALVASLTLLPRVVAAQELLGRNDSIYTWRGTLPSGGALAVRNPNGPVDVRASSGSVVEVKAEKRTGRSGGALRDVAFDVRTAANGDLTFCVVNGNNDPCEQSDHWDNDGRPVTVALVVLVPRAARLRISTGNGAVSVEGTGGEVQASTGNGRVRVAGTTGSVRVSTGNGEVEVRDARAGVRVSTGNGDVTVVTAEGPVDASSGNGDLDITMSAVRAASDMRFGTGRGSVRLTLPTGYNGELDASTGHGEISSDFDLQLRGRVDPRHIRATIGSGGPLLRLSTGSGRLELRKGR